MRWLIKLLIRMTLMGALVAGMMKYGRSYIMPGAGVPAVPGAKFSSDETDMMSTVLQSAWRLFSGSASRNELANELSDKLYDGRDVSQGETSQLGIEIEKKPVAGPAAPVEGEGIADSKPAANPPAKPPALAGESGADPISSGGRAALAQLWEKAKPHTLGLALVLAAVLGTFKVLFRKRGSRMDDLMPPIVAVDNPADTDALEMRHAAHSLKAEEFELLVALIYQRQGYRVALPAGLGGERGVAFTLLRKSERVLVQCRRLSVEHKVPVERVRELQEAVTAAGATRGIFVASCGFTWDARQFGKSKQMMLINARVLDELIDAAQKPGEDLLAVSQWAEKFLGKVELTTPKCPACEAKMELLNGSAGSFWVCSQRPECRGRRSARNHHKGVPAAA